MAFPEKGQAVISEGLAEVLDIQVGDSVLLHMPDMDTLSVTVSGIFDNNVYHYVLVSMDTVLEQWGTTPSVNTAYVNVPENQAAQESATTVSRQADVLSVMLCQDIAQRVSSMMTSLNYIVALVVLSAAALAFIVMYNLTNINITERIREIATIKVLGFYPAESAAYVFREGMALTAMAAPWVGRRKAAAAFIIRHVRVDMVYFTPRIFWTSYLWAVVLTFLFACIVDLFLYFKLERINMAEALKSVE